MRLLKVGSIRKWIISVILVLGGLWSIVHIYGAHSESFNFVRQTIMASPAVKSKIGLVSDVRLPFFGEYRENGGWASMQVDAVGVRDTARIRVELRKGTTGWRITRASIAGELVPL
jgi:hypothetical protein